MINAQAEVDRMLSLLRNKIRERGFTQLKVQADLKWGRSYISQLLTKQKSLRVEQVLQILDVIGVDSAEFFAELFRWPAEESGAAGSGYVSDPLAELAMRRKLDNLQNGLEGLVRCLVNKNVIAANESVAILSGGDPAGLLPAAPPEGEGGRRRRQKAPAAEGKTKGKKKSAAG